MAYLDPVWNNIYEEYVHNVVAFVELLITRYDRRPSSTPVLKYCVRNAPTSKVFPRATFVREKYAKMPTLTYDVSK